MKTIYPKDPICNFNDWILYIKEELTKCKTGKK